MERKSLRNLVQVVVLGLVLVIVPVRAPAQDDDHTLTGDRGTDMAVDVVIARPAGVIATAIGSVLWVVALPFTLPTGSAGDAARELVIAPAQYTFKRPLGDFSRCGIGTSCLPVDKKNTVPDAQPGNRAGEEPPSRPAEAAPHGSSEKSTE